MKKLSGGRGGREERALEKRLLLEASAGVALYVVQKLRLERKKERGRKEWKEQQQSSTKQGYISSPPLLPPPPPPPFLGRLIWPDHRCRSTAEERGGGGRCGWVGSEPRFPSCIRSLSPLSLSYPFLFFKLFAHGLYVVRKTYCSH